MRKRKRDWHVPATGAALIVGGAGLGAGFGYITGKPGLASLIGAGLGGVASMGSKEIHKQLSTRVVAVPKRRRK